MTEIYKDLLTLFQLYFKNPKALANAPFLQRELLPSSAALELGQFWHQFLALHCKLKEQNVGAENVGVSFFLFFTPDERRKIYWIFDKSLGLVKTLIL